MFDGYGMALYVLVTSLIAGVLSSLIGIEREMKRHEAGLRTHVVITIVASILAGIGFMGAGTMVKNGLSIRGLTTASTVGSANAIGMACGSGFVLEAIIVTAVALLFLPGLTYVEHALDQRSPALILTVSPSVPILPELRSEAEKYNLIIKNVVSENVRVKEGDAVQATVYFAFLTAMVALEDFNEHFASYPYVHSVESKKTLATRGKHSIKNDLIPLTGAGARGNPLATRPIEQPKKDTSSTSEEVKE